MILKTIRIGCMDYCLEVANTIDLMRGGLAKRNSIDKNSGMLFDFGKQQVQGFWMDKTKFNLDLIFLNHLGVVVSIKRLTAHSKKIVISNVPISYAIELARGQVRRCCVKVNDRIIF